MGQTISDIEILIADDGSTDASGALAEALAREDARITVLRIWQNGGKPAAMNRMVAAARGMWIAVLDADDAYHRWRLEKLLKAAEGVGVEMVADNLVYVDSGADQVVQTAFAMDAPTRVISKDDLLQGSDSFARFDFGILKPMMRADFVRRIGLSYFEQTRLAEDYYYLLTFFLAGGKGVLTSEPLYFWTMPFGAISRAWTTTGSGAWRYDYRTALAANEHFIRSIDAAREPAIVAMLRARSRQYQVMIHYLDAQRAASERRYGSCVREIVLHPSTYGLLLRRVWGRLARSGSDELRSKASGLAHPRLRPIEGGQSA
jgi:glycosyltransferase involved in cell wall biosynthesis